MVCVFILLIPLRCQSEKWADMGTFNTEWAFLSIFKKSLRRVRLLFQDSVEVKCLVGGIVRLLKKCRSFAFCIPVLVKPFSNSNLLFKDANFNNFFWFIYRYSWQGAPFIQKNATKFAPRSKSTNTQSAAVNAKPKDIIATKNR